jgi:myo-inositol 2-dehydrogenase/D-chiro-inositol 1-dehydrogenase
MDGAAQFKIGLIGCGTHARLAHGPSLRKYVQETPGVRLVGACDLNFPAAQAFAADFGFANAYADVETLLAAEHPDALSVVLPTHLTCAACIPLLRRGIPLLIEKPPAMTSAELRNLVRAADHTGAVTQVAFNRRYTSLVMQARELLEKNVPVESVFQIDYDMIRCDRRDADFSTTAVHAVDTLLYLARSPFREVRFRYRETTAKGGCLAGIIMEGSCESGASMRLNVQPLGGVTLERAGVHALDQSLLLEIALRGADPSGVLRYWRGDHLVSEARLGGDHASEAPFEQYGFYAENKAFFDAVREGEQPLIGVRECAQQIAIMEAIRLREPSLTLTES